MKFPFSRNTPPTPVAPEVQEPRFTDVELAAVELMRSSRESRQQELESETRRYYMATQAEANQASLESFLLNEARGLKALREEIFEAENNYYYDTRPGRKAAILILAKKYADINPELPAEMLKAMAENDFSAYTVLLKSERLAIATFPELPEVCKVEPEAIDIDLYAEQTHQLRFTKGKLIVSLISRDSHMPREQQKRDIYTINNLEFDGLAELVRNDGVVVEDSDKYLVLGLIQETKRALQASKPNVPR